MKAILKLGLTLVALCAGAQPAVAQDYPNRPIRLVVPFPAGGGVDSVARTVAEKLSLELRQPILIDNRGGAGGALGASLVSHAPADGYTLLLANNGHAILSSVQKTDWDPLKDFRGLSNIVSFPMMIFVNAESPYRTLADMMAAARAQPGKLTYASSGVGGTLHLGMEMFKSAAGINILHVPYKGNAPMTTALLSNEVSMSLDTLAVSMPQVRAGKFRPLAVTSTKRLPSSPDVPTIAETVPGFEYEAWQAMFAPSGTPPQIVERLNAALVKVVALPDVQRKLIELGYEPRSSTAAELDAMVESDVRRFRQVVREANIKAE